MVCNSFLAAAGFDQLSAPLQSASGNRDTKAMGLPRPTVVLPEGAVECHSHVYDPDRFPFLDPALGEAPHPVSAYRAVLLEGLGFSRVVVVQPGAYGADNRCTLDAVAQLGLERARAVVATAADATAEHLRELHRAGARGLRLSSRGAAPGRLSLDDAPRLAPLCADLGWHLALQIRDGSYQIPLIRTDVPSRGGRWT